ncbi:MAG: cbb3-type cytochrome oxidase assembly protein CcoS [Oligoflexia bacterium]
MNIVFLLMPLALLLGGAFLAAFAWTVKKGQYDDLETPAHRILFDDSLEDERT